MNDLNKIVECLKRGGSFVLVTHTDPDADGICSMLALGRALKAGGKDVVMVAGEPLSGPLAMIEGASGVVARLESGPKDAVVALDCSEFSRMSPEVRIPGCPLINVDHHRSNVFFGDMNMVDAGASSTAEMVWRLIQALELAVDEETAGHLLAGAQSDTGSFIFRNTTSDCLYFAAEMVRLGARPWDAWRRLNGSYGVERLRLIRAALETVEFHHCGKIGVITVVREMLEQAGASYHDCGQLVDFPRNLAGVEIAVMILEAEDGVFRFSLRSTGEADVAAVAGRFGGGGHKGAAGFELEGYLDALKCAVIDAAADGLDGRSVEQGC